MRRVFLIALAVTVLSSSATALAQKKRKKVRLKGGKDHFLPVEVGGADGMNFHLHLPKGWKPKTKKRYPLLITLHGNGGSSANMLGKFQPLSSKKTPLIIVAIGHQKTQQHNADSWTKEVLAASIQWVFKTAAERWHADRDRLFLQGFSMGSGKAQQYAAHAAKAKLEFQLRGLILNSGFYFGGGLKFTSIPTLCVAGEQETDVNGTNYVETAHKCANFLFRGSVDVRLHIISGMGHSVNVQCVDLVRDLIFEECGAAGKLEKAIGTLKKRWKKHKKRWSTLTRLKARVAEVEAGSRADRLQKSIAALEADPLFAAERDAWSQLEAARKADRPTAGDRKALYEALVKAHPKTEAGRTAKVRLTWMD